MLSRSVTVALIVAAFAAGSIPAEAARRPKPTPCSGGRFVVTGERLVGGSVLSDAIVVAGKQVSTESGCAPVTARVKAKKRFTQATVKWSGCAGLTGPAVLKAKIDAATCRQLTGTFKAKKDRIKRSVSAALAGAPALTTGAFTDVALQGGTVGTGGGTVTAEGTPLAGLEIVVPPGAADEAITFTASVADITGASGLPNGARTTSKLIRITATGSDDWNQYRMFDRPIRVTLPYDAPADGEESVRFYVVDADGSLNPAGLEGQDTGSHRLTFFTRVFGDTAEASRLAGSTARAVVANATFATYVAVGLAAEAVAALTGGTLAVDSGFLPSRNGWYIPNYGSYYKKSRGGSCFGFVGAARYYFEKGYGPGLYSAYHDANDSPTWVDDAVAIEFTSRVHNGMADIWGEYVSGEVDQQTPSSRAVALSFIGGLYVTGAPVLLYIQQAVPQAGGGLVHSGAHAISIYRAEVSNGSFTFHVYDPNFPGGDGRRITYTAGTGFATYLSGTDAGSSAFNYNYFKHVGYHVGLSDAVLDAIKTAADAGFAGASVFPQILITSISGGTNGEAATEGTTDEGEHKWIVNDNSVRIVGTVLGGLAQDACCVVNNAHFFVSNKVYFGSVDNAAGGGSGAFDVKLPVGQGENDFVVIASKKNSFSHWAGFLRDVIESTYSPAALTVTLAWGQAQSDVDLYVKEPDGPGGIGDTVYYSHRRGLSDTNPYLDFDNTSGYGPEHYLALPGMVTLYQGGAPAPNLYGDYTVKVHYYADHDGDSENTQPISWSLDWRYLAFCPDPCTDPETQGFWQEGAASGGLSAANSGNCCNIGNSGADWSGDITISYPQPDPASWGIPDPPSVMLP